MLDHQVIGVIELSWLTARHEDEDLLRVLATAADQIAQFVQRRRAEADRERLLAREKAARTEAEQLVGRLQKVESELRQSDQAKNEFLAVLGHELRNPLAPLRHVAELMRDKIGRDPNTILLLEILERQVSHLVRLVEDLLDISRIAKGRLELRKEPVDLPAFMRQIVDALRGELEKKRHRLSLAIPHQPLWVEADPTRLEQVLTNLISNAANYTEPGGRIWFGARKEDNEVAIWVRDTGIGIPPEMLESIFDPVTHPASTISRPSARPGLGIGLMLVRKLVEMHGGKVTASSGGAQRGSEFVVRLPLVAIEPERSRAAAQQPAIGMGEPQRVLVVDDNKDAAESLGLLLRRAGHEVQLAYDGPTAIEAARSHQPEVVFLDIHLPGSMDGYEVARRLRAEEGLAKAFIVAVTGFGLEEDRRRSEEAGFDRHVVKPLEPAHLRDLMTRA